MRWLLKIVLILYWLGLMLWVGSLMTAGIAAMNTFGTLPDLGVSLDSYPDYPSAEHGRLAAGIVMERNFFVVDVIQMLAAPLVIVTLLVQLFGFGMRLRRPANVIRIVCLLLAAGLFAFYAFSLAPRMNRELRMYWSEAEAGQLELAEIHRANFNRDHPRAELIMTINLFLLIVGVSASAAAFVESAKSPKTSNLEPPELLKKQ